MELTELVNRRRSCRKYANISVPRPILESIMRGTLMAPSSKNMRTSRFVVVTDSQKIALLSRVRVSGGSAFVAQAPVVVVVMSDTSLSALYVENSSISATFLQLLAENEGLGSCWVQIEGRMHNDDEPQGLSAQEYVQSVLPATEGHRIECIIAIGYPEQEPKPHTPQNEEHKVIWL